MQQQLSLVEFVVNHPHVSSMLTMKSMFTLITITSTTTKTAILNVYDVAAWDRAYSGR